MGDLVLLSTKDLKYQMVGRRTEKLMERFVRPYKVKSIVSMNALELELPSTVNATTGSNKRGRRMGGRENNE